ncbi:hypothetical protein VP01_5373g1 [Puccinia sorghi]|uniref:No apical meristem-associated C-terminal domain-containing protein n=1 Tax=Puccinia sorghi TaxID=27349 RepID=A0A0L6UJZ6_9BASI|nr:hypothetical protein VP01_5373g1 [Puccinia sorghi]
MKIAKEAYYNETRKLFTFEQCWNILRDHKKWKDHSGKKPLMPTEAPPSASAPPLPISGPPEAPSPSANGDNEESICLIGLTEELRVALQHAQVQMEHKKMENHIMNKDLDLLTDEISRQYFEMKKRKIMDTLEAQEHAHLLDLANNSSQSSICSHPLQNGNSLASDIDMPNNTCIDPGLECL